LRLFAERGPAPAQLNDPEPPHLTLLFRALKPLGVAEALLGSALPAVRCWAARRAVEAFGHTETTAEAENLLWRAVEDSHAQVRQIAVDALLVQAPSPERVVRLFESLANRPADEGARALEVLERGSAWEPTKRAAREALSAARPV